jgi:hypothetical protein
MRTHEPDTYASSSVGKTTKRPATFSIALKGDWSLKDGSLENDWLTMTSDRAFLMFFRNEVSFLS